MMDGLEVGGPGSIEMGKETKRRATYADIEALPENMVGQLIDGELIAMPRPASPHAVAHSVLGGVLLTTFQVGQPAKLRPFLLPLTEAEPKEKEASAPPEAAAKAEAKKEHMPRLDWAGLLRRTFVLDVLACAGCGGRLKALSQNKWNSLSCRIAGRQPRASYRLFCDRP